MTTRMALAGERLTTADGVAVSMLLDADPVGNVYLRSELRHGITAGDWWGVRDGDSVRAVLLAGVLAVPCIPESEDAELFVDSACAAVPPRMLVGPRDSVLALHQALAPVQPVRELRSPQPLLTLDRAGYVAQPPCPVRRASRADVEPLVLAAAAMHQEEMGIDPMRIDASAWRARMTALVDGGWSWVWTEAGRVIFKAELSAWTPEAVQIQGVYTDREKRGHGVAARGLAAVCATLLQQVPVCSLYVNHYNHVALRLYDRLGFRRSGDFATVIY